MDAVGLKVAQGIGAIGHASQEERHQAGGFGLGHVDEQLAEVLRVARPIVRGHLHAQQQHPGPGLATGAGHVGQVVARHVQRQPAQRVVAPQFQYHHVGLVLLQQGRQARTTPRCGVPADAGIDHLPARKLLLQTCLQQGHPAAAPTQAVFGAQ